eukprot:gene49493-66307_t
MPTLTLAAEISDPQLRAQMDVLQGQREAVDADHKQLDSACYRRFLVNACRADVARSLRVALAAIKKQELVISQQQRALLEQEAVRADQLRRETAAEQERERQARLLDRAQREQDRAQRSAERESDELERQARVAERAQREADRAAGESRVYGIVLLSDGADTSGKVSENRLLTTCLDSGSEAEPTKIFAIAFGDKAERDVLEKISAAS